MSNQVSVDIGTLETLMEAAREWAEELVMHIAPASVEFGDSESAESQVDQSNDIARAYERVAFLISDTRKAETHGNNV